MVCVFQLVKSWTVIAVWRYLSVLVHTWDAISLQGPLFLRTATPGEGAICTHKHAGTRKSSYVIYEHLKCLFFAVCVVTVPGNVQMKAALVRDTQYGLDNVLKYTLYC